MDAVAGLALEMSSVMFVVSLLARCVAVAASACEVQTSAVRHIGLAVRHVASAPALAVTTGCLSDSVSCHRSCFSKSVQSHRPHVFPDAVGKVWAILGAIVFRLSLGNWVVEVKVVSDEIYEAMLLISNICSLRFRQSVAISC